MSLLNPYDDFSPSDESFSEKALDLILGLGLSLWLLILSPTGAIAAYFAWLTWGGALLVILGIIGVGGLLLSLLIGAIALIRFLIFERSQNKTSRLTSRLIVISTISSIVSSISGLVTIIHIFNKLAAS